MMTAAHLPTAINRLAAALLLGALGRVLLLNAPTLVEGLVLRLDEAVTLFAAMALGGPWGAIASLTATIGSPAPAFSAIWAAEALVVGAAVRRGAMPVPVTAGYWLAVYGLSIAGLLPASSPGLDLRLMLAKQLVNATLSASVAQVVLAMPSVRTLFRGSLGERTAQPLRVQIARAIVPLSTIPVVLLGLGLGAMYARDLISEGTRDLAARATTTAARLADYVAAAEGDVGTLAGALSMRALTGTELERTLALHHAGSTTFVSMLVSDAQGEVAAASSRIGTTAPQPTLGVPNVADRPYFSEPERTGRPFRSDGFMGRGFGQAPIVVLSAPFTTADGFGGVAQGALNLDVFGQWLEQFVPEPGASVLVLDRLDQVIASTGPGAVPLLTDARVLPWVGSISTTETATFAEPGPTPDARPTRHLAIRREVPSLGWQVLVRRPLAAMQAPLVPFYVLTAAWLLSCLLIAIPIAGQVSRRITQPLEMLAHNAEAVGRGHVVAQPSLPPSAPAEVLSLQRDLEAMVQRLDESVTLLDQKVRERSAELASAMARTDTIFQAASDGMLVTDAADRIIEANDAVCRMLGVGHDVLTASRLADLEVDVADDERRRRSDQQRRTGTSRYETSVRTTAGVPLPVEVVVTAMPGGNGHSFAGVRDISERRRADAERAQLESRLRQSQKMEAIGTLAGGIAHDFNNILTLIAGSADMALADVPDSHAVRPYLEQILRASQRAEALVRQILAFSRRRDDQRDVVAIGPIVQEAAGILRSTLPAMVEIRIEIGERLPLVQADPVQLHQVLMNLGTNAAHAMRERGGLLAIAVHRDDTPNHLGVRLTVQDAGAGMDAATLERAFEPFFTTKPAGIGTGLGLAVVHGIVTAHGGIIEATSMPDVGTTVCVTLPSASSGATPRPAVHVAAALPSPHRPAHVLVVDDEPELVGLLCQQLVRLGYSAQGCAGPAEALETLSADTPHIDVVVSDLAMPKMSGIELAERIRRDHANVSIVLCSGRVTDEDRERAGRAGIAEILAKPFATRQLAEVLERSLGTHGTRH